MITWGSLLWPSDVLTVHTDLRAVLQLKSLAGASSILCPSPGSPRAAPAQFPFLPSSKHLWALSLALALMSIPRNRALLPIKLSLGLQPGLGASSLAPFSLPWGTPQILISIPSFPTEGSTFSPHLRCLIPTARTPSQDSLGGPEVANLVCFHRASVRGLVWARGRGRGQ